MARTMARTMAEKNGRSRRAQRMTTPRVMRKRVICFQGIPARSSGMGCRSVWFGCGWLVLVQTFIHPGFGWADFSGGTPLPLAGAQITSIQQVTQGAELQIIHCKRVTSKLFQTKELT